METTFKPSKKQYQAWEYLTDDTTTELGYGGGACFSANTKVLTPDGYKKISEIKKGDFVISLNELTDKLEESKITNIFSFGGGNKNQKMIKFKVYGEEIKTTPNHRFYIKGTWLPIGVIAERIMDVRGWNREQLSNLKSRSFTNKELEKLQEREYNEIFKRNDSKDIQHITSNSKRYYFKEKLEAFELDINAIESIEFIDTNEYLYDLEVEKNENYIVSNKNIIVHNSGGKSYLGCVWITTMCLAYPNTAWLIGRKELTNLKRTTIITLFKVFKDFGIKDNMYSYNQQNNILTFSNGSQIFFLDLGYKPSDPLFTRLGGLELTGAFVDEANECPVEAINILKTRLGRRGECKPKLLETFNPDKGHVYSRYYRPNKEGTLPPHRKFIPALATDNPHTTEEYLEQLRNSDKITKERLLFGNFEYDDDPSILVNTDAFEDLFTNTVDRNGKFISIDVARYGKDKTAIGLWNGYELSRVYVYEKYGIDQLADIVKTLASQEQVPFSRIIIDEDGVGGGLLDTLRGTKGFMGNTTPFPIWDTRTVKYIPANFQNLKAQCYFKLAEMINNHKLSVKDETIKELLREDLSVIRQKNQDSDGKLAIITKDEMKEIIGRSPDISDMMMMRMYFEFKKPSEMQTLEQRAKAMITKRINLKNQFE